MEFTRRGRLPDGATGNVVVVIPAYKPSPVLADLVSSALAADKKQVIRSIVIVNDGSGPAFAGVFSLATGCSRVEVIHHAVNLGKGAALKTGFNHALVTWPDLQGVVTADADGQHTPQDIVRVAEVVSAHPDRVVVGVRQFDKGVPFRSRFGNTLTKFVFRLLTGISLADTQTGLRGWPRKYCEGCLRIPATGYDFELECLLNLKNGQRRHDFLEVPIEAIYLDGNRSSHFNPILDSMRVYFVFARYCASAVVAAITDSLVFYSTFLSTGNVMLSQSAGRACAVTIAFTLARNVVFKASGAWVSALAKYLTIVVVMGLVSYGMIQFFRARFGWPILPAKLVAEGLLFLGNFAIQREFVFVGRPDSMPAKPTAGLPNGG